jgi:hypothetical protein
LWAGARPGNSRSAVSVCLVSSNALSPSSFSNHRFAIRGREQQLIDSFGGAWSDTGQPYKTGNEKRGVDKDNAFGRIFHEHANQYFGQLHPYTGN